MEKVYEDPDIGAVVLRKTSRSRRISLRVNPRGGVTVSMPWIVPFRVGLEFFLSRREWVLETIERQNKRFVDEPILSPGEIESLRKEAKKGLPARLWFLSCGGKGRALLRKGCGFIGILERSKKYCFMRSEYFSLPGSLGTFGTA